jgi:hypothetical protein
VVFVLAARCYTQFWSTIKGVSAIARLVLHVLDYNIEALGGGKPSRCVALRINAEAELAPPGGRNPNTEYM